MNHPEDLELVQLSSWARHDWLRHGFSTRSGGVSTVYSGQTLNLGWTKEDAPESVAENRSRFTRSVSGNSDLTLVTIRQVHSAVTHVIRVSDGASEGRLATPEGKAVLEGDGLMTNIPGVLLAVGTADCIPVLVIDPVQKAVAAFHAGWRGTAARIVEHGIQAMQQEYGSSPTDLIAAIGPGIGPCCYSVGDEVLNTFSSDFSYADQLFHQAGTTETSDQPKLHLDLWQANRHQLLAAGLRDAQITLVAECTSCSRTPQGERRYFSHRSEQGHAGRMLNAVGITE